MAFMTLNGGPVDRGVLTLPRSGVWVADLVVELASPPGGSALISLGGDSSMLFAGTVIRAGVSRGAVIVRVLGGGAGLRTVLPARGYRGVTLQLPLTELLTAAGETLSAFSDPAVLGVLLPSWSRFATSAGVALQALLDTVPLAGWRVASDGTVWVGIERWPPTLLDKYVLIKDDPQHARQEIASDLPRIYPGETLLGRRVSSVEHRIEPHGPRATIFYES